MKFLSAVVFCLVAASAQASGLYAPAVHHVQPVVHSAIVKTPVYAQSYIPQTVKLGESHHSYPGATYAIPAVRTVQVTRPGYTTYLQSSVTKQHVTNHQVAGPTYSQPIIAPVVTKALAPVVEAHHGAYLGHGYGHGHAGLY